MPVIILGYIYNYRRRWVRKSKLHIHMMQEGSEIGEGQESEALCTDTTKSESGEAEGQKGLYLAGADSSFLIRPHMNTYGMEISGPHTFTHRARE